MKVRVLGCGGGIGETGARTTSLLVDDDILIDAGTGVADLSVEELARIDHVFLTHSHLDHIAMLPFLVDSVGCMRNRPLTVYALEKTLKALKKHIFNWKIWPDFAEISLQEMPAMQYHQVETGEKIMLGQRAITALPAAHTVPAIGYLLDSGKKSLAFTGDTGPNEALWPVLNGVANLRYLLIETTFSSKEKQRAALSKHLCPETLAGELKRLERKDSIEIHVCHFKPAQAETLMDEIQACAGGAARLARLLTGHFFEF
ncbi:MAG: 3',5'-cyclic-nucleotide phosphodiesterase [Candidatus Accumulibacter sp.]|jgi:ribonuclease BN (tRNA processing enzyme)|nr:3',5'-cyclic-nucleotide phosphodiesterase [Accumulibacter sp.]